jgi:hypothetical protein
MAGEWERPIIADSGNGAHLLYRIDLANDQEALAFVMGALAELDRRYSDDLVKVDLTCANAARIWKAYGTVARKGDSIPGRPPRVDSDPRVGFDMDGYLARHYLAVTRHKPWTSQPGGLIYELNHCPFDAAHVNGSAAFTLVGGKPGFRCQHDGCRGKTIQDVFALYPANSFLAGHLGDEGELATAERRRKASQSQLLIELATDVELFHTSGGEAFASLSVGDHREVWPLKSTGCRRWFTRAFYQKFGKAHRHGEISSRMGSGIPWDDSGERNRDAGS